MLADFARRDSHPALQHLADRRLLRELAYVDGRWTASETGRSFEVRDPASGATLAFVASLGASQTCLAIDAAAAAFPRWRAAQPQERGAILRRWYELILEGRNDLAPADDAGAGQAAIGSAR
jgi:aspartate-semialdehyde dehydrogenase